MSQANVLRAFGDLESYTEECPRGCDHHADAPECGLDLAVERGDLAPERLASFRRMEQAGSGLTER